MGNHLRELNETFLMNTNMTGFRWFFENLCVFVFWTKVASALEGLTWTQLIAQMLARTAREVRSAHVGVQLTLLCKRCESPHCSWPPSDVTLTLDSARLGVSRALEWGLWQLACCNESMCLFT